MKKIVLFFLVSSLFAANCYSQSSKEYCERGLAKYKLEDYLGAITDYTKALEIDPQFELAYCFRGNAKSKLEDYVGTIEDYTKALEIDPTDASAYYFRSEAKNAMHDYTGAMYPSEQIH